MITRIILTAYGPGAPSGPLWSRTVMAPALLEIGSAPDCALRLPDESGAPAVSPRHCRIEVSPGHIRIGDLGSPAGTSVNGSALPSRTDGSLEFLLRNGDNIGVGPFRIEVRFVLPVNCRFCGISIELEDPNIPVLECGECKKTIAAGHTIVAPRKTGASTAPAEVPGYEILGELGRGAMGVVYLAKSPSSEKVALKLMRAEDENTANRKMIAREISVAARLKHPNIVEMKDSGYHNGFYFMAMSYCEWGNLYQYVIRRGGSLGFEESLDLIMPIVEAVNYAHGLRVDVDGSLGTNSPAAGIIHRDLKPQNLFLADSGGRTVLKVGDYGLAKVYQSAGFSNATQSGAVGGSPFYMPRQQITNYKYVGPEVDVWALAACLYFALTGLQPRDFSIDKHWMEVVMRFDPVPIRERRPGLPETFAATIDEVLKDRPNLTCRSAADLAARLQLHRPHQ